ncbi:hypothetical protein NDU88_002171 [Pleurodeles waltl]|uniref:Uncharacterized protein n=1 Tax=Pleurodeles waltl TaxID=8319 RepID=A0AAV7UUS8_PLEWA|nr:hypothetical protein NDU88_002171 [Pleurodeles waltl]
MPENQLKMMEAGALGEKEELSQGIPRPKEDTKDADQLKEPGAREALPLWRWDPMMKRKRGSATGRRQVTR